MHSEPWYRRWLRSEHCTLCGLDRSPVVCPRCRAQIRRAPLRHPLVVAPFVYAPPLTAVMSRFKYQGRLEYLPVLTLLLEALRDDIPQRPSHVCALPLHWLRAVRRGFNQSELLAHALASTMGVPNVNHWLHKPRSTRPQVGLDAHMRQSNVKGAFAARQQCSGSHVLLVDDVMTTGATLLEARAALLDAGAKQVDCLVLAATKPKVTQAM